MQETRGFDSEFTFKTTGAGGEDAIFLLGLNNAIEPARQKLATLGWREFKYNCQQEGLKINVEH